MGSGTFKDDRAFFCPVNQQPVRFNVTFVPIFEFTDQDMIAGFAIKRPFFNQISYNRLDIFRVTASLCHQLQVFGKAVCINGRFHQTLNLLNISSASLHSTSPLPFSLS
jgi:hypothetical protein